MMSAPLPEGHLIICRPSPQRYKGHSRALIGLCHTTILYYTILYYDIL